MRIVFAGIIGRYPWGGVTWCSLMYLLGLRKLGHDVYYLEDTTECNYDPEKNAITTDPGYALRYIHNSLEPFGFGERWCYVDYQGGHHGIRRESWETICRSADLFLVLSGGCWIWRGHYLSIPVKAFIDSDPAFTQLAIHRAIEESEKDRGKRWYVDFFRTYDRLFTFGCNIGTERSSVPTDGFSWHPTRQPVGTDLWTPSSSSLPPRREWTTVMTWKIESFTDIGGNKDEEFVKVLDLARKCADTGGPRFELAVSGPVEFLEEKGWRCTDAFAVSKDLWRYHGYISSSRGEFSVAKQTYVRTRSGWFSDRTECYLASGRPAVVQETGFSDLLQTGEGLIAWETAEEAREALGRIEREYEFHSRRAREVAEESFSDRAVLPPLLDRCFC